MIRWQCRQDCVQEVREGGWELGRQDPITPGSRDAGES